MFLPEGREAMPREHLPARHLAAEYGLQRRTEGRLLGGAQSDSASEQSSDASSVPVWEAARRTSESTCGMLSRRRTRRRRRCESYEELEARYVRYAVQIDGLVRKTGRKWKRLHAVRARQRRVLYKMLQFPAWCMSKALRRVKPYIADKDLLREYEQGVDSAQVYVHVNPEVRSSYVGQHKGVASTRKEQHDRSVLRVQLQLEGAHVKGGTSSWQREQVQRVHKFEARNGGVGMWCDMPVQLFAPGYQKLELLRGERHCSNRIGNLNVQGHALLRRHVREARAVRRGRSRRAVCRMRGCDPERERERVRATVFAWRAGDQRMSST